MYVPMMKTRQEEFRVAKELNICYSENLVPLFEILDEIYEARYETDEHGKYLTELRKGKDGKERKYKIKSKRTINDIITLDRINDTVNNAMVFIDYFRFDIKKYGNNIDLNKLELAYKLNNNNNEYVNKLKEISTRHKNMIPVLSLKKPFKFSQDEIIDIIKELKKSNDSIALRIEDEFFESCKDIIEKELRESDFLLYDISEQNFYSKIVDIEGVSEFEIRAKKIILNSPRKLDRANKEYENKEITVLVDNSVAREFCNYNFEGFGDYGGLKDQLPANNEARGSTGAALALIYNYEDNSFYSFCNSDTKLGQGGYRSVIRDVLSYKIKLDSDDKCYAYKKVEKLNSEGKYGGWKNWNNIALTRYIHQMYRYI